MLGVRTTTSTELEEITTEDGSLFNTIAFSSSSNIFKVTNINEKGLDGMSGTINIFCTEIPQRTEQDFIPLNSKNNLVVAMYPNPVKNKVTIATNESGSYFLVNLSGQVLLKGRLTAGTNELNTAKLANGLYFLNIETIKGITSKKLIKQ